MNKAFNLVLVIVVALIVFKATTWFNQGKISRAENILKKELLKNDSLIKINDGLYTKLVSDTSTVKDLRELSDSLKLKLDNPKIITRVVFIPKKIEKQVDKIFIRDSIITIEDNYPDSINPFITYFATINIKSNKSCGTFSFTSLEINLGIGQNKDGTYYINTKLPEFLEVSDIDVQALPKVYIKPDNFGVILGTGLGKDYNTSSTFMYVGAGIRFKKTYIEVGGSTNQSIYGGIKFEL